MTPKRKQILSRIRQRVSRAVASAVPAALATETFALEIPGASPDKPLWRLSIEMTTEPEGDGERLKMRLHWQSNPGGVLALAAPAPPKADGKGTQLASKVGGWVRGGLVQSRLKNIAQPLLNREFNSWMEVQASTADLDRGASALLSESQRLKSMGVEIPAGDSPLAQTWTTAAPGANPGFAQLSLLRLDKRHLPKPLAALLGDKPFQFAAAIVNVVEEKPRKS